jgi:hypothetical protein
VAAAGVLVGVAGDVDAGAGDVLAAVGAEDGTGVAVAGADGTRAPVSATDCADFADKQFRFADKQF